MTPDFLLGLITGGGLVLLIAVVWGMLAHLKKRYEAIQRDIRQWRRIKENEERARRGLPPRPAPIEWTV